MAQVDFPIVGLSFLFIKSPFSFFYSPLSLSRSDHALERFSLASRSHTLYIYFSVLFSPHLLTTGNYSYNLCCINVPMAQRVNVIVTRLFFCCSRCERYRYTIHYVLLSVCTLSKHDSISSRHRSYFIMCHIC